VKSGWTRFVPVLAAAGLLAFALQGGVAGQAPSGAASQPPSAQPPQTEPPPPPPPPPAPPPPRSAQPTFRAGVDVVSLSVTVTDPSNHYVTDLDQENFQVYEDGVLQEITYFTRSQLPFALALLIDTSASMEDKLATAQEAAIGFAKRLSPQDMASVIDFDSRVVILQPFTNDVLALEKAIRDTSAGGSTSLYNAIYIALNEIKKNRVKTSDEVRRQAIVVLSDGEDTSSLLPFEEVLELAKRSETAIYAIGIRAKDVTSARGFKEAEFVLRQISQETGGRPFFPTAATDLPAIYTQIAEELSSQYTIGYQSRNPRRDGQWRRIVVRTNRQNATARTKLGYYGPTSH
jgi:Ca-activated chloride channel family protein